LVEEARAYTGGPPAQATDALGLQTSISY